MLCVYVHLCLPRSVALSRVRTCTRLETQVSFGESRAREKRRDARGSAVRARLTEGESRYWEQSAGEVCSPRLPPLSPPPGCRVALALSLHPPAASTAVNRFSFSLLLPFFLSLRLSPSPDSFRLLRSSSLRSCTSSLSLSLPPPSPSLSTALTLGSRSTRSRRETNETET